MSREQKGASVFLGLANYYPRFVPRLQETCQPLNEMLRKDMKRRWSDRCEKSFNLTKEILANPMTLCPYDHSRKLVLTCDDSYVGVGASLCPVGDDELLEPIAFASRKFSGPERNYSVINKDALAAIHATKRFHILPDRRLLTQDDFNDILEVQSEKVEILELSWPTVDKNIEDHVATCFPCQTTRPRIHGQPLLSWDLPVNVWSRIHVDIAGPINGQLYLVAMDSRGKWPEVWRSVNWNTSKVTARLDEAFARLDDKVWYYNTITKRWLAGIIAKRNGMVSYLVRFIIGKERRIHGSHLRKRHNVIDVASSRTEKQNGNPEYNPTVDYLSNGETTEGHYIPQMQGDITTSTSPRPDNENQSANTDEYQKQCNLGNASTYYGKDDENAEVVRRSNRERKRPRLTYEEYSPSLSW
ncbi:hypothetical protein GJ496_000617 [Pomphorhynchus laevis]|nr:hypothetical protein GJ496_000617 [Pomphorhynchus laevis]